MLRGCGDASPVMEVPERFCGSPVEGSQQLSAVVEVELSLTSEAKPSDGFPQGSVFRGSGEFAGVY